MNQTLKQSWDLEILFPNGSASVEFAEYLAQAQRDIALLGTKVKELPTVQADVWADVFEAVQNVQLRIDQSFSFTSCLTAQDVKDSKAKLLQSEVTQIAAAFQSILTQLDKVILEVSESDWQALLKDSRLQPIAFPLNESRRHAANKLPAEQESLITDLSVDGYHAWSSLYYSLVGRITIPFEKDGELQQLSVGQAQNLMDSEDRAVRAGVFAKWEEAFAEQSELISSALNHLSGFRVQMYKHRGWESVLSEPLDYNRMSAQTLETMWNVIEQNKAPFVTYLQRKAELLGVEKMSWYDQHAPIGQTSGKMSYEEGAAFIIEQFNKFNPQMATFAERAFAENWIESEDRPGKQPGGFCTGFPADGQTRIFMTYDGSTSSVSTLAHELGHAYHSYVMDDMPYLVRNYAMNVAETASTFAELIVADAALKNAQSDTERIVLLDNKLQNSIAFFMNIHSRFLFETRFYDERKKGSVSVEKLNSLMEQAQKDAFHNALDKYHPHFWASKLHFYSTGAPFYNFPYTFGYLFSSGVYARALEEGVTFAAKYDALLRDTARMTTEELALKHLGVDLTQPEFWQSAVDMAIAEAQEFLSLTEK